MKTLIKFYNFCLKILDNIWALFIDIYMFRYDLMVKLRVLHWIFALSFYTGAFLVFKLDNYFYVKNCFFFFCFLYHHIAIHSVVVYRRIRNDYLRTDFYETHLRLISDLCVLIIFIDVYYDCVTIDLPIYYGITELLYDLDSRGPTIYCVKCPKPE